MILENLFFSRFDIISNLENDIMADNLLSNLIKYANYRLPIKLEKSIQKDLMLRI